MLCYVQMEEAKKLGAHHFLNSKDDAEFKQHREEYDVILNTTSASLPWDKYLGLLAPTG